MTATRPGKTGSFYPLGISRVGPAGTSYLFEHISNDQAWSFFLALLSHLAFVLVNKKAKNNLANQYPAILTSRLVKTAHID